MILVIEDDRAIATLLTRYFEQENKKVLVAPSKNAALRLLHAHPFWAIILDLGLPDGDGKGLIQTIRKELDTPVIILSARHDEAEIIASLDLGADDYITKPFSSKELFARIRSARRRISDAPLEKVLYTAGELILDTKTHSLTKEGHFIKLTPTEFSLLRFFMQYPNQVLTHKRILKEVWGVGYQNQTQYLRTYINSLRKKIEVDTTRPVYIQTESSIGYRFFQA
ncbi:response regulator transcription factor [Sulfurospirillum sp. T05]|uniref:Response regulator transcription factor n=1 Tax=Sulfurospirillum tamanense TaxID=2813362 RepID=A0ABS2WPU8_9BACT|nr:response regulator transcription factor [Sulfurospirillum tamanensis]MBN2963721.1 response regulator transcription factor [Sulfurospirillum tamanensis]